MRRRTNATMSQSSNEQQQQAQPQPPMFHRYRTDIMDQVARVGAGAYGQSDVDPTKDNYHNGDVPVCTLLRNAANDVFPELSPPPSATDQQQQQQQPTPQKGRQNHQRRQQQQQQQKHNHRNTNSKKGSTRGNGDVGADSTDLSTPVDPNGSSSLSGPNFVRTSLFGSFVRSKFLYDSKIRTQQLSIETHHEAEIKKSMAGGRIPPISNQDKTGAEVGGITPAGDAPGSASNGKKKKRNKKKKKKKKKTQDGNDDHDDDDENQKLSSSPVPAESSTSGMVDDHGTETVPIKTAPSSEDDEDDNNSISGDSNDMGSDKLEELLNDQSHSLLLLPTGDDNKSVDSSIEAMDQSVKRSDQLLKIAAAKHRKKSAEDLLKSIPNESGFDRHSNHSSTSVNGVTSGSHRPVGSRQTSDTQDDEQSYSNVSVQNSVTESSSVVHNTNGGDGVREVVTENEDRFLTSPLNETFLIAPDARYFGNQVHHPLPEPTQTATQETNDTNTKNNKLEVPISGITDAIDEDDGRTGQGKDKPEISRRLLEEWIDNHLLPQSIGNEEKLGNNKNLTIPTTSTFDSSDFESFIEFCNESSNRRDQAVGIPFTDVMDSIKTISCPTCKATTVTEAEQLKQTIEDAIENSWGRHERGEGGGGTGQSILDKFVLDPSYLQTPNNTAEPIEDAFAYHRLEEGNNLPRHHQAILDANQRDVDGAVEKENLSLVIAATSSADTKRKKPNTSSARPRGTKGEKSTESGPLFFVNTLTTKQMENYLKYWVPCGVDTVAIVGDGSLLSSNPSASVGEGRMMRQGEFDHYKKRSLEISGSFLTNVEEMMEGRQTLQRDWTDTRSTASNRLTSFGSAVGKLDKPIKNHMSQVTSVLTSMSENTSHEFAALQLDVWASYLGALSKISKTSTAYYSTLEQLSDQNTGSATLNIFNPAIKEANREFLDVVIRTITDLSGTIGRAFTKSVVKEWATRLSWQMGHAESDILSPASADVDKECQELVLLLSEWVTPIRRAQAGEAKRDRQNLATKTTEKVGYLRSGLKEEFETVQAYFPKDKNEYISIFLQNAEYQCGRWNLIGLDTENESVLNMASGILLIWRQVRIMQSRMIISNGVHPMPLRLTNWMMHDDDTVGSGSDLYRCGMGKRRLACILAGLSYKWFGERFNEWTAIKAEQELLTDFDGQSQQETEKKAAVSKSSKKKARRKNKQVDAPRTGSVELPKTKSSTSVVDTINENNESDKPQTESVDLAKVEPKSSSIDDSSSLKEEVDKSQAESSGLAKTEPSAVVDDTMDEGVTVVEEKSEAVEAPLSDLEFLENYKSKVVIYDNESTLSVEDFLVQRFENIMKSKDQGKLIILK